MIGRDGWPAEVETPPAPALADHRADPVELDGILVCRVCHRAPVRVTAGNANPVHAWPGYTVVDPRLEWPVDHAEGE